MKLTIALTIFASITLAQATFEVISIKPTPPEQRKLLTPTTCDNGRFVAAGQPLSFILNWTYGFDGSRLLGLPEWAKSFENAYNFEAKAAGPVSLDRCKLMMQSLFADRFKMVVHRETREMPVYALVIGKSGSKIHEVASGAVDSGGVTINRARQQSLNDPEPPKGWPVSRLVSYLSDHPVVGRPVIDKTGLAGIYTFSLEYSNGKEGDERPSIYTAVQEQLGLKLEATKAPLEVLVIDHLEKASAN